MSADEDHLVRKFAALHNSERVPDGLVRRGGRIGRDRDTCGDRAWANVVPERKPTLPRLWNARSADVTEQFRRVAIGNRHHWNARNARLRQRDTLYARSARYAWGRG